MTEPAGRQAAQDEDLAKLTDLIADIQICMFTTRTVEGVLMSRPMAVQEVEFDGDLWFFTKKTGRKVDHIEHDSWVNVALSSSRSWISINGRAEIVEDPGKAHQLWNARISAWFPDGPDDPSLVLVRVEAEGAEYWDTPGGAIVTALSFAKSRLTGKPYHVEDRKLDL